MIRPEQLPIGVTPMETRDIPAVIEIERLSYTTPWSPSAYRHELEQNELAHYFIVAPRAALTSEPAPSSGFLERFSRWLAGTPPTSRPVLGYAGYWLMAGEAHISTIAVHPDLRGRGLGEYLLLSVIGSAIEAQADLVTLEVRVSNTTAQRLYEKYGFDVVGQRKRYYHDNNEDALIMTVEDVQSDDYREFLAARAAELLPRLVRLDALTTR